jgi:cyclopropane fatty-acyl-phospholipid synthase-like methyltransferase
MPDVPSYEPAQHYDRVTDAWTLILGDELHYGVFERADEDLAVATGRLTDLMIESARLDGPVDLLDVGSGTGATACRLAAEFGVRALGITTSQVGVTAAARRARATGVDQLATFEERDGTDNGLGSASFDVVWALESSHLMRRRDRLIAECARVLRAGGRFVMCDIVLMRPMDFRSVKALRVPLALLRSVFGDARMEPLERYEELCGDEGLVVDDRADLTAAVQPTFAAWHGRVAQHETTLVQLLRSSSSRRTSWNSCGPTALSATRC